MDIYSNSNASEKNAVSLDEPIATTLGPEFDEKEAKKDDDKPMPDYKSEEIGEDLGPDDAAIQNLPWHVRRIVSLHDDTTLPTITFRYFLLVLLFVPPGAFLQQMNMFRTTSAPYSIFFVQIAASYVGDWMGKTMPAWEVKVPFTRWKFNTNPGPFSVKEHVLVVIAAASGATYNLAWGPLSLSELYFKDKIHPAIWIAFMLAIVWTGYSYAAIARQFLVYDPTQPWFDALCQTALFETQTRQREFPSPVSRRQMKVFFCSLLAVAVWQILPEYAFPMLSSLAVLCWIAPNNAAANFVSGGLGGMGFLNLSLNWSNVGNLGAMGSLFLTPWYTQVVVFSAFVVNCWFLLPLAKWGRLGIWDHGLMSNRLFMGKCPTEKRPLELTELENGTKYPVLELITPQVTLNETAYAQYGPLYVGAQQLWGTFFDYASYTSVLVWMGLFGYPHLKTTFGKYLERRRHFKNGKRLTVNEQYSDQLNVLMRSYEEVPPSWFLFLFLVSFVIIVSIVGTGYLYIPLWTYFIALATGAVVVIPLGWLYSLSNFQLPIGTTNELLYGLMVNAIPGYKNPVGATVYGAIAGNAWYRAQNLLQDQKLGHYMHVPPRAVFFSQIFGSFVGVPINYAVIRWVLDKKGDYLVAEKKDPTNQWTGQTLTLQLTVATQYVLIGPKRLFATPIYRPLAYGFLLGALVPLFLYLLHRRFPRAKFNLWNCTIFFCTLATFWGNISTGWLSGIIGGFVVMCWAYRHHYELWARYNYILAAAFDSGYNLNALVVFLCFSVGKRVLMPHWWGNDARSVERCFALDG
ncbi:related to sexual differentiation process protein isp4 [Rhynchosporium agropyri]|uniref:Related to sexual differentiation process protein isp4 n=1 Tax=Rhynchosporium agropyri TaxID=914238 RepID=A0A1E1L0A0_9HELO|nr:related to sexual differentiation process protein isp4 [Rhynchosporium agropyri]